MKIDPQGCREYISNWLDPDQTPFWASRYAALMFIRPWLSSDGWNSVTASVHLSSKQDPHRFVRAKAKSYFQLAGRQQ